MGYRDNSSRGVFRSIYINIWDDVDFKKLTPNEKLLLLYFRTSPLSNMPVIYKYYFEAIEDHTGLNRKQIIKALDTLSHTLWVTVSDGYIWMRNGLKYDPNIYLNNEKHISGIKSIIESLPKLKIVNDFCKYYNIPYTLPNTLSDTLSNTVGDTNKKEKEKDTPNKIGYPEDSKSYKLSCFFLQIILDRKPDFKKPTLQKWANTFDLMIRIDNRNPDRIAQVIEWSQKDPFWKNNILSPDKLRKQFDNLELKMEAK